jgi:hypothetical protein
VALILVTAAVMAGEARTSQVEIIIPAAAVQEAIQVLGAEAAALMETQQTVLAVAVAVHAGRVILKAARVTPVAG